MRTTKKFLLSLRSLLPHFDCQIGVLAMKRKCCRQRWTSFFSFSIPSLVVSTLFLPLPCSLISSFWLRFLARCRRLVIDLNFMCTQQRQQQQAAKKWISTALFVRPDKLHAPLCPLLQPLVSSLCCYTFGKCLPRPLAGCWSWPTLRCGCPKTR